MGRQIILSEEEKRNIQKMYGLINEQYERKCVEGDCRNGTGTQIDSNGSKYVGGFDEEGRYSGNGTMVYANDAGKYEGEWFMGRFNGTGTETKRGGAIHKGEFKDGVEDGPGILTLPNGATFEGVWKDGKMDGTIILTCDDGTVIEQEWVEGRKRRGEYCPSTNEWLKTMHRG